MRLKEILKGKIKELEKAPSGFDVVGNIAIVEIKPEIEKYEKEIAKAIIALNKNIKTVAKKISRRYGKFRLQKLKIIFGSRRYETVHTENRVKVKLDIAKCYFSPRLANERLRIARQVKVGERVLVMFSGVGIYPLVIAKNSEAKEIVGIELNKIAHRYAVENVSINKLGDKIKLFLGDVAKVVPKLNKFDRLVVPLPFGAESYLNTILRAAKNGTIVHYYAITSDPNKVWKTIEDFFNKNKIKSKLIRTINLGSYAPGIGKYCFDFILKKIFKKQK